MLGLLALVGGEITLFKGLDEMKRLAADGSYSVPALLTITLTKLAALVIAAASGFRGGRIFPAVFVGVALGLMLHQHVPAVPAAITVSCAIMGLVLVVTRDGWLSLFMAVAVVPDLHLLPVLCIVMLPAWLALAGKPLMLVNRRQPPRRLGQRERRGGAGVDRGGVEHRHRRIPLAHQQAYFGAAENNPLRALLLQIADDPAILVARGIANFTQAQFVIDDAVYDVAIGADRRHHVDAVQFLQAAAIEGLLHGKARAQQPDAANVFPAPAAPWHRRCESAAGRWPARPPPPPCAWCWCRSR